MNAGAKRTREVGRQTRAGDGSPFSQKRHLLATVAMVCMLLGTGVSGGCSPSGQKNCESEKDCFKGEICNDQGKCVSFDAARDSGGDRDPDGVADPDSGRDLDTDVDGSGGIGDSSSDTSSETGAPDGAGCTPGDKLQCGTSAGICEPGVKSCKRDGTWGPCKNQKKAGTETCDAQQKDEDCDGSSNENCSCQSGDTMTCGTDEGECKTGTATCTNGTWSTCQNNVGRSKETCDGNDNDCDGKTDENVKNTYYRDSDNDGYGTSNTTKKACSPPNGYVNNDKDCDDGNDDKNPGETETCNGVDDDCDGMTDENVKNTYYRDSDNDGYGTSNTTKKACSSPNGYVNNDKDCDDGDDDKNPRETETCNTVDDDCDGMTDEMAKTTYYRDSDGDGYGASSPTKQACSQPNGYVSNSKDCYDSHKKAFPNSSHVSTTDRGDGSFDYDCDQKEEKEFPDGNPKCSTTAGGSCTSDAGGWADGTVPDCGVQELYQRCSDCMDTCRCYKDILAKITQSCQ